MAEIPLPQSEGRLSQSCDIFATSQGNIDPTGLASWLISNDLQASGSFTDPLSYLSSVAAQLGTAQQLGSIERLEIRTARDTERIYSLGRFAFEPYRVVPKTIKTELQLSKVVLYTGDILSSLGFPS